MTLVGNLGTVVTDMPVYRGEEFGLEPDAKVLLFNDGSITGRYAPARRITGKEIPADFVGRRAGDPACLYATSAYARETLGWQANHSDVDTLVSSTWGAYCKHQEKK